MFPDTDTDLQILAGKLLPFLTILRLAIFYIGGKNL